MILWIASILIGFVLLAKGADVLVDGACSIAQRFGVSDLIVGLTVVALGTSAPELVVSVASALKETDGITLGTILGSNIANLCLVLGVAGLIAPMTIRRGAVWREIPFCVGMAGLLLLALAVNSGGYALSRFEAVVIFSAFVGYLWFTFRSARLEPHPARTPRGPDRRLSIAAVMVGGGLAALILGGETIVRNCVKLAEYFGLSEGVVGITIVALGTSLPELATAISSVAKGRVDLAVGNVVGSNILNVGMVLAVSGLIRPMRGDAAFAVDAAVGVGAALLLFFFMFTGKKHRIDRWEAALFLLTYAGYMAFAIYRG